MWCGEWRGITGEEDAEVVEQLCGCTDQDAGNSGEFCGVRSHDCCNIRNIWVATYSKSREVCPEAWQK